MNRAIGVIVSAMVAATLSPMSLASPAQTADDLLSARPSMAGAAFISPLSKQPQHEDDLRAARKRWGSDSLQAAEAMVMLGHVTVEQWRLRSLFRDALDIVAKQVGEDHPLYGRYLLEAGSALAFIGKYRTSDDFLDRADAFYSDGTLEDAMASAKVETCRAMVLEGDGEVAQAATFYGRAADFIAPYVGDDEQALELAKNARSRAIAALETGGQSDAATPHILALGKLGAPGGEAPPRQVFLVPPRYPRLLLINGVEGEVVFKLTVTAAGFVKDPVVESVTGPDEFGKSLLDVVRQWRFAPRLVDGEPVSARVRNRYYFSSDADPES